MLTFALLETETDSLECEGGYPESTIPRSQTGDQVGCINVARVRGDREQESAKFALASLVATSSARSSSIKQTRHQKVANLVVEISVLRSPSMPKPYDLRKKVIEAIEQDGMKKSEVSQLFNISRNTIDLWLKRQAETRDYQALPNQPLGNNNKIADWEKFRAFAKIHGDKTQVEMAKLWSGEISDRTISRALQKIGFTQKKDLWLS
jgi:transposase